MIAACLAFLTGAGYLVYYAADSGLQEKRGDAVRALCPPDRAQDRTLDEDGMLEKFGALYAANSDLAGWLRIPGAGVDLPVMREETNRYYLNHDPLRSASRYGALFLDAACEPDSSLNLAIYGHNTKNGSMFGQLHRFLEVEFYRENAVFEFDTLRAQRRWVVFAVFLTNTKAAQDDGYVFEWREEVSAEGENIGAFAEALRRRSVIDSGIDVLPGDRLLSLTTCAYEIKDGRLVVCARALREGEEGADVSFARANPAPLYPRAWYDKYGGEKPQ